MPRQADPARRIAVVDAAIRHAAEVGFAHFTLRGVANSMGRTTRVVTHHFADKLELTTAMLERLHELEQESLTTDGAWSEPDIPVSHIISKAWRRTLSGPALPQTQLIHEIEALGAAGRTPGNIQGFLADRATFVAACLEARGVQHDEALVLATLLNGAYSGLQLDHLTTGDHARTEAALARLCSWIDDAVAG